MRRITLALVLILTARQLHADPIDVEGQPLAANVARLIQSFEFLGAGPFTGVERASLDAAIRDQDAAAIQRILEPHVLLNVHLNPESRVKVTRGAATATLQQRGYTPVVVRVHNESTVTARLRVGSPQAGKVYAGASKYSLTRQEQLHLQVNQNADRRRDRFLDVEMFDRPPMTTNLSGLTLEYAIALIYSHESGKREATIRFDVGQGTEDLGFRGQVPVLFDVLPAVGVTLRILDEDDRPTTARLVFRDKRGRVYPPQAKRVAPDLFFQQQVYRADGQTVELPPGEFTVQYSRGPEYVVLERGLSVPTNIDESRVVLSLQLKRWVNPMKHGFYSGDHHIHASGCAHYTFPTIGIDPIHVLPHVKGEGLNVGCILTWGPGFEHQRTFFKPVRDSVSEPLTLIKYDLEISGFGSQALGHVCLLNLKDQTYPGSKGTKTQGWPSWTIPVMRWAKQQGGVTGYAHSASGLHIDPKNEAARLINKLDRDQDSRVTRNEVGEQLLPQPFQSIDRNADAALTETELFNSLNHVADTLPNYAIPGMNGVGAMEIAVASVEGVCDFISAMDTARIQEWNTWYHLLNCDQRIKVSGETDFPCMSGKRVGQGRVYVQLGDVTDLRFDPWCKALAAGRSYVSDGFAHALRFSVNGVSPGFDDVTMKEPGTVTVQAKVAFAPETPIGVAYGTADPPAGRRQSGDTVVLHVGPNDGTIKGGMRRVEVIVNGNAIAKREVPADGREHDLQFQVPVDQSSWIAIRQFPQLHTNPVYVIINGEPIRASRRSALWCVEMIEKLWTNRSKRIRKDERDEAHAAYQRAIKHYRDVARLAAD